MLIGYFIRFGWIANDDMVVLFLMFYVEQQLSKHDIANPSIGHLLIGREG